MGFAQMIVVAASSLRASVGVQTTAAAAWQRHGSSTLLLGGKRWMSGSVDSSSPDTHDDFKPKYTPASPAGGVAEQIQADIATHDVFIYMKGVPGAPQCGFSNMACKVLDAYGVKFGARNVLVDPELREGIKKFSNWPTIPQVFVMGEFVGGSDILLNMHETGELEKLLQPIITSQQAASGK